MAHGAREKLIVFARWPEAGATKTRLIPALGQQGAADLHRHMTRHTLRTVDRLRRMRSVSVEVRYDGGDGERMAGMFGDGREYVPQGDGDLGARMRRAVEAAMSDGAGRVIVIGTDCPQLTAPLLNEAFVTLGDADVTLGPAADGGYYLIGLSRAAPALFAGVEWGTDRVLDQTRAVAGDAGLSVRLLVELADVDRPEDVAVWERVYQRSVSVIVPARNEAERIAVTLDAAASHGDAELIVVDGGSTDDTAAIARRHGAMVITSKPGRAVQMNAGADVASGGLLLFCHADTHLPPEYDRLACDALERDGAAIGAFDLSIRGDLPGLRRVERAVRRRCRWLKTPYGDQALFLRRAMFDQLGGYRDLPIMEDYDLVKRAKKLGDVALADGSVSVSARFWQKHGIRRATWINQKILWGWRLGVSPAKLAKWRSGIR